MIVKATQTISLTSSAGAALQRRELFPLITALISSLPALLNSFPLCPPPFPSAHLALAHNRCEARHKHGGRCVARGVGGRAGGKKEEAASAWRCESPGAFDPIKRKEKKKTLIWTVERVYRLFILCSFLAFLLARRFPAFTFGCRPPPAETRERRRRHKKTKKEKCFDN